MNAPRRPPSDLVSVSVAMTIAEDRLELEIPVPAGPATASEMLPIFRHLAEDFVRLGVQEVEENGLEVSCRRGCGACCRQLVPISETEARRLRALIDELPEPRRSAVRARFAEARVLLERAGLLAHLEQPGRSREVDLRSLGLDYFRLGIACPFLEEESCSIYADRPMSCREYLVTSPAEHCADPSPEAIRRVPIPATVSAAVYRMDADPSAPSARWVPLILVPSWAEAHPDDLPGRSGPEWLRELFTRLAETRSGRTTPANLSQEPPA